MRISLLSAVAACLLTAGLAAQSFTYSTFNGTEPITTNGAATVSGSAYRLNPAATSQKGSIFHQTQHLVTNGFDTTFTFKVSSLIGGGADGMAFVIHNDPRGDTLLTDHAAALGYGAFSGSPAGTGVSNALVIEIDTWSGNFNGFSDGSANEISIHTNGTGSVSQGEDQSLGRVTPAINMSDGQSHTLRVLYTPGTVDVFLDGAATPTLSVPWDFNSGGTHFLTGNTVGGVTLSAGAAWIGFTGSTGGSSEIHDIESWTFTSSAVNSDDAAMARLVAPTSIVEDCSLLGAAENVTVEVRNAGINPILPGSLLTLSYQVNSNAPVIEIANVTNQMNTGDTLQFTFATPVDLSAAGTYTLTATVLYALDIDASNDTISPAITSGGALRVTNYPYVQDFTLASSTGTTTPPLGFFNETTDSSGNNSDWVFRNAPTPTTGAGPAADHTTGIAGLGGYAHIEDDGNHAAVNLRSPCFDLGGLINPSLRFWLHSNNANPSFSNLLSVDVITYPSGSVTTDVFGPQGATGASWAMQAIDLSSFAGQLVQIVFRGESMSSGSNNHDIAIDDFSVVELMSTPGQAPQPGLAVLNVNDPVNANGDPLQFGFGGPYFVNTPPGSTMTIRMQGEAIQPIILFSGPLNPQAASYPGIGSVDCGGPVDPVTGIPTLLQVLGDGTQASGLNSFFVTAANGEGIVGVTVPNLPPTVFTMQCVILNTTATGLSLSNAVQVNI